MSVLAPLFVVLLSVIAVQSQRTYDDQSQQRQQQVDWQRQRDRSQASGALSQKPQTIEWQSQPSGREREQTYYDQNQQNYDQIASGSRHRPDTDLDLGISTTENTFDQGYRGASKPRLVSATTESRYGGYSTTGRRQYVSGYGQYGRTYSTTDNYASVHDIGAAVDSTTEQSYYRGYRTDPPTPVSGRDRTREFNLGREHSVAGGRPHNRGRTTIIPGSNIYGEGYSTTENYPSVHEHGSFVDTTPESSYDRRYRTRPSNPQPGSGVGRTTESNYNSWYSTTERRPEHGSGVDRETESNHEQGFKGRRPSERTSGQNTRPVGSIYPDISRAELDLTPVPVEQTTLSPEDVKSAVSAATVRFSVNVFKKLLSETRDNVVVSPTSVQTLLAMLQQGAVARSAGQLENVIHMSPSTSRAGYSAFIKEYARHKKVLAFANKFFIHPDFSINPDYTKILRDDFSSGVQKLSRSTSESVTMINDWVKANTDNRITSIVKPEDISTLTKLVLANVIFFKAQWLKRFNAEDTTTELFFTQPDVPVEAQMMNQKTRVKGSFNTDLKAHWLQLFYYDRSFSMVVVLPTERFGLDQVIEKITPDNFHFFMENYRNYEVNLKMPRFEVQSEASFKPLLMEMGLTDVFGGSSRLDGLTTGNEALVVTDILHNALLQVTEEGTQAAGASAAGANTLSLPPIYEKIDFNMTQPFLVIIVDNTQRVPLFMARISNPGHAGGGEELLDVRQFVQRPEH